MSSMLFIKHAKIVLNNVTEFYLVYHYKIAVVLFIFI